ncbi:MAG: hypothetical protein AAFP16_08640 [Pseudomonadota bacterium]
MKLRPLVVALSGALLLTACEEPAPPQKPEPKSLSAPLRQDVQKRRVSKYEQLSRCAGLHKLLLVVINNGKRPETTGNQRLIVAGLVRAGVFQTFALQELQAAPQNRNARPSLVSKTTSANVDAFAGSYGLVLAAHKEQTSGIDNVPFLVTDDLRFCESLLKKLSGPDKTMQ